MATPIHKIIGFLDDEQGRPSSMRLMAIISLLAGIGFGVAAIATNSQIAMGLSITWAGLAYTGKIVQKREEKTPCE